MTATTTCSNHVRTADARRRMHARRHFSAAGVYRATIRIGFYFILSARAETSHKFNILPSPLCTTTFNVSDTPQLFRKGLIRHCLHQTRQTLGDTPYVYHLAN